MTPDETTHRPEEPTAPRFRERRSAFVEDDETTTESTPIVGETAGPATAEPRPEAERAPQPTPEPAAPEPRAPEPRAPEPTRPEAAPDALPDDAELDLDRLDSIDIPPASFHEIVEPLRLQALQFLGEVPLTEAGEKAVLPRWAKHVIDLLGILEERTRGNLPSDENEYMVAVLDDLRTRYLRLSE